MIKIGENIFYTDNQSVTGSFHVIAVNPEPAVLLGAPVT
jgi:hypothetical protein